jgi:hypothetical protein
MKKALLLIILFTYTLTFICQSRVSSLKYNYSIEIPKGFSHKSKIGKNVDFSLSDGIGKIVIVLQEIPLEYRSKSFYEITGNIDAYYNAWQKEAYEFFQEPKVINYGKTAVDEKPAIYLNYSSLEMTTEGNKFTMRSKNYQLGLRTGSR